MEMRDKDDEERKKIHGRWKRQQKKHCKIPVLQQQQQTNN